MEQNDDALTPFLQIEAFWMGSAADPG